MVVAAAMEAAVAVALIDARCAGKTNCLDSRFYGRCKGLTMSPVATTSSPFSTMST